jgi:hypothetical protein
MLDPASQIVTFSDNTGTTALTQDNWIDATGATYYNWEFEIYFFSNRDFVYDISCVNAKENANDVTLCIWIKSIIDPVGAPREA